LLTRFGYGPAAINLEIREVDTVHIIKLRANIHDFTAWHFHPEGLISYTVPTERFMSDALP
jgi:hypothetical protein